MPFQGSQWHTIMELWDKILNKLRDHDKEKISERQERIQCEVIAF